MSYRNQQLEQIDNILQRLNIEQRDWNVKCVTMEICRSHEHEVVGEAPMHRYNTWTNVRREVKDRVNQKVQDMVIENDDTQLRLFDRQWEHLQERYIVKRDGEDVAILLEDITDEELEEKAQMHDIQGNGHFKHAKEIREYIALRNQNNGLI